MTDKWPLWKDVERAIDKALANEFRVVKDSGPIKIISCVSMPPDTIFIGSAGTVYQLREVKP